MDAVAPISETPTCVSGEHPVFVTQRPADRLAALCAFGTIGFDTYLAHVVRDEGVAVALREPGSAWAALIGA